MSVAKDVEAKAYEIGFDAVGFARPEPSEKARQDFRQFLNEGRQASMQWLADRAEWRMDPKIMMPSARSIVMLGLSYAPEAPPRMDDCAAYVSIYARGRDYHDVMKKKLRALARWMHESLGAGVKLFVDTAPLMEKPLAAQAGLGWQGKHTNLVSRRFGSWLFLGSILTDIDLPPARPEQDRCANCTRCIDACPTGALEPYRIDPGKCVSYLTIECKDEIDDELKDRMGKRVFGCDDCLNACPWNKFAKPTPHPEFRPRFSLPEGIGEWQALDEQAYRAMFAQTPVRRCGHNLFKRNLAIAERNGRAARLK